jgi:hypothetical protein
MSGAKERSSERRGAKSLDWCDSAGLRGAGKRDVLGRRIHHQIEGYQRSHLAPRMRHRPTGLHNVALSPNSNGRYTIEAEITAMS